MSAEPGFRYRERLTARKRPHGELVAPPTAHHRRRLLSVVLVILLLVPAGVLAVQSLWTSVSDGAADPEQQMIQRERQAAAPTPSLDPANPFDQTPADDFPVGADGITLPPATQVGNWAPSDVQYVLNYTKQALTAARLDPAVVVEGNAAKYLSLLSESARTPAQADITKGAPALGYVTRIAPGYSLAAPIRVKGTMSVALGEAKQLVVTADHVWVYPLKGPVTMDAARGPGATLVVLHTVENYQWYPQKGYAKRDQGLRPGQGTQAIYNMDCELSQRGLLALPRTAPTKPGGENMSAFDPATKPEQFPSTC